MADVTGSSGVIDGLALIILYSDLGESLGAEVSNSGVLYANNVER